MTTEEHILHEEQFINIILNNKDMVRNWLATPFGIEYFDQKHDCILRAIIWAYNEGVQLTRASYKFFAEQYTNNPSQAVAQQAVYNRILLCLTKKDDFPALLERVKDAYIQRKTTECLHEYDRDRKQKGIAEANRLLSQRLSVLDGNTVVNKSAFIDLADHKQDFIKALLDRKANPAQRLTCDIGEIDSTMGVGFIEGGLSIFCAGPKAFKTTIMMNIALNVFHKHNANVLFLPLEMPYEMMMQRIISRETGIPFDRIIRPSGTKVDGSDALTDVEIKTIDEEFEKWKDLSNRFKVLKIAERAKVSTIRAEIEKRISYFKPRLVIIDYIDNVVPESANAREDLKLRDMFEDMIKMGANYGFHVITAAKLGRSSLQRLRDQSENKQELDSTDIHGGQEFGANATAVYGQLRNKQQPGGLLDFFCMVSRYANPIFENGRMKTNLKIEPATGLITTGMPKLTDGWGQEVGSLAEDVMSNPPPNVEDEPFA